MSDGESTADEFFDALALNCNKGSKRYVPKEIADALRAEVEQLLRRDATVTEEYQKLLTTCDQLVAKVERLKAERDHAREALQDEVRLRGELQNRTEAAERKLKETRKELSTVKIQMWLIRLGRDWWILQASRAMSPERFKELQDVPADEKARAALAEGKGG